MCILRSATFALYFLTWTICCLSYILHVTTIFALSTVDLLFQQIFLPSILFKLFYHHIHCSKVWSFRRYSFVWNNTTKIGNQNFGLLRALTSCDVTDCTIALVAPSIHKLCIPLSLIAFLSQPKLGLTLYNLLLESNSRITNQTPVKSWVNIGPC